MWNQLGPRYEGQLIFMAEPISQSKRPPRTPSRHSSFFAADGRAETDGYNFERYGHSMRTVLTQFEARGVHLSWAPYDQLLAPQVSYLLLGRWSTDRPLTPCTDVSGRCYVQTRLGMEFSSRYSYWLYTDISRLRITSARHEGAAASGGGGGEGRHSPVHRVSGSEPRRLRTHRLSGRSRPPRSTVVEYQAPSIAVWH